MHKLLTLLAFGIAACGSPLDSRVEEPLVTRAFNVEYRVEGTYAGCDVSFNAASGLAESVRSVALPWTHRMRVQVASNAPFTAGAVATCADPVKTGKSVVSLFVDGTLKDMGAGVGYGASAQATYRLHVGGN